MRKLSCASVAPSPRWSDDWTRLIHAAIIIAKHNHGRLVNGSVKDALAGDIEVIAVHQGKDRVHARLDDSWRRSGGE